MHKETDFFFGHTLKTKHLESLYQIVSRGLPWTRLIEDTESVDKVEIGPRAEL